MAGVLYIVATPIGNLNDITRRAIETLGAVDLILCEDTRTSQKLLAHFGIEKPLQSYHQHSALQKTESIIAALKEGKNIALVSDAGTPGISDPGNQLVAALTVLGQDIKIVPLPGANAAIAALSVSGFPTDKFVFLGFPPVKNKRQKYFEELLACEYAAVFYESNFRILKTLAEIDALNPDKGRRALVCRELTKMFETVYRGTVSEVAEKIKKDPLKGEFVAVFEGKRG
ncbi:MAG: 16S rRNA (cytidine(1402)-2'-O)-methyltransferase [Candidatus Pacebacteria bacterium]|jgi:16S rRNA (cytidine1402-2'-O)-methyltransferase|nr:16S rRNA (cytidine(1402)-2'-O)-methyltransferase [Candidatus Paceibacterota bacterium]